MNIEKVSRIRPILLMLSNKLTEEQIATVQVGVQTIATCARVLNVNPILIMDKDLNAKHLPESHDKETVGNMNWLEENCKSQIPNYGHMVEFERVQECLNSSLWSKRLNPYFVFVTAKDMFSSKIGKAFGLYAYPDIAAITAFGYRQVDSVTPDAILKTVVMHTLGHVWGLVPETRSTTPTDHCSNEHCIMRFQSTLNGWATIARNRLKGFDFCKICERDLQKFFE